MKHEICGYESIHQHSDFSLQDGFGRVFEYADRHKENNQRFLSITDHGVMGAVPQQITECDKAGLFPIFGIEMYVNSMQPKVNSRQESADFRRSLGDGGKIASPEQKKFDKSSHLLGLAYTYEGYKNLVTLSSWAWIHGFYKKPRVNHEILMKHKEGIIFTSTCGNSEIANAFMGGPKFDEDAGFAMIEKYMAMFGENFRLELMMLDWEKQKPYDVFLLKAHAKYGIPIFLSGDCHFCLKHHSKYQRMQLMSQKQMTLAELDALLARGDDEDIFVLQDENLWVKSEAEQDEMWEANYKDIIDYELYKEAKRGSVKLAEMAKGVKINRDIKLPKIPDAEEALWEEIKKGFLLRKCPKTALYAKRVREEFDLITEKGFASYFIIQKMMTDEARRAAPEILGFGDGSDAVGPGRGCLHPLVPIRMVDGTTKPISQVQEGESVWTIDGSARKVEKVMRYDLKNEPLLQIHTYYGGFEGVVLTGDHKIFVEKQQRPDNWDKWAESTRLARKSVKDPVGDLNWIRADELKVGDWCFVPTPQVSVWDRFEYDLSEFSNKSFRNGKKLTTDDVFVHHQFNSKNGGVCMRVSERIWSLDEKWAFVLGVFVGDGWTRSEKSGQVGFCGHVDDNHLEFVEEVFNRHGVECSWTEEQNGKKVDQLIARSTFLEDLFDALHPDYQHNAHTKHVPDCILNAPLNIVQRYLHGYFLADGHEDENKVKFETVSFKLAEQIRYLLLRMGLPSSTMRCDREDIREEFKNNSVSYVVVCPLDKRLGCTRDAKKQYVWRSVDSGILLRIRKIESIEGEKEVYDLQVEGNHNYLTGSFLVHNSVCGSLVAYCLRLHDVDPIQHDLRFSRFLSPARGGEQMKIRHSLEPVPHERIVHD